MPPDAWVAVGELHDQIGYGDPALVLIFFSAQYDRERLAEAVTAPVV